MVYTFSHTPVLLPVLTALTIIYTQLVGRVDFRYLNTKFDFTNIIAFLQPVVVSSVYEMGGISATRRKYGNDAGIAIKASSGFSCNCSSRKLSRTTDGLSFGWEAATSRGAAGNDASIWSYTSRWSSDACTRVPAKTTPFIPAVSHTVMEAWQRRGRIHVFHISCSLRVGSQFKWKPAPRSAQQRRQHLLHERDIAMPRAHTRFLGMLCSGRFTCTKLLRAGTGVARRASWRFADVTQCWTEPNCSSAHAQFPPGCKRSVPVYHQSPDHCAATAGCCRVLNGVASAAAWRSSCQFTTAGQRKTASCAAGRVSVDAKFQV